MEWTNLVREAIEYIEDNLLEVSAVNEIANHVFLSEMYLQRGFKVITGCNIKEYIRYRRLSEAAKDVESASVSIDEIAEKYRYKSANSFIKAFIRFHKATPFQIRNGQIKRRYFPKIEIETKGVGADSLQIKRKTPLP